ncbi:MAG: J domain-containing protein [Nitrospira sp.]|nr:J domain-containing protein [Nitrospira sp.]
MDNFYKILEVPLTASADEIQRAYRQLIQVWHPDRFQGNPELMKRAEQETKQLNEAYRHLSDPQRRAQHDESLDRLRAQTVRPHESPPDHSPSQQTKEAAVVTCPNPGCAVGLRVPTKRRLKVACPRCNTHFMYDSTLESTWNIHVPESNEHSGGRQAENPFTAVVSSGQRKPIYWVTSVTGLVIVWAILVMAIVFMLNSEKLVSQPSLMSTALHPTSLPQERSVVVPLTEVRTRDFRLSPVTPGKGLSVAPTSTAPHQTALPKEEVFLATPTQSGTQDTIPSSHVTPEADRDMSQPIPRVERQPFSFPARLRSPRCPEQSGVPSGRGSLKIVNGTQADALVQLGEYAERGGRLLNCKYVKAGQGITIEQIGEGAYRLAFSLGRDFDNATERFRNDRAYTVFDEPFEFKETREVEEISEGEKRGTRTRIRFVEAVATLHAVLDGHAETSSIDEQAFDRLFDDRD